MIFKHLEFKNNLYKYLLFFLLFLLLLSFSNRTYGEDLLISEEIAPSLEYINREDGLSNLSVSSIVEDKYGILWFGTQGGLNRYDGKSMTTYRNDPFDKSGLLNNLIQTMTYDEINHELWIGTYQGLSRYNIFEDTFINYTVDDNNLSDEVVVSILLTEDVAWIGTLDGLNKLDLKTNKITNYFLPEKTVRDLIIASDGQLYLATYDGLYYLDGSLDELVKVPLDLPSSFLMTLDELEAGTLTFGLWEGGLATVDLSTKEVSLMTFDDNRVYAFLETSDKTKWIATWGGGLFAVDKANKNYHFSGEKKSNDLPNKVVYSLHQSDSGLLWIGTNGGGIVKINPRKKDYIFLKNNPEDSNSLSPGKINMLHRDIRNDLWIAVYNTGIQRYDASTGLIHKYNNANNPSLGNNIRAFFELDHKTFLVGSESGLSIYSFKEDKFSPFDIGLENNIIYDLERQDDLIWIATYHNGLYTYDLNTETLNHCNLENENNDLVDNLVFDIHLDQKNRLWVATNKGLNLKMPNENTFKSFYKNINDTSQLPSNDVSKIFEDDSGNIWIGTGSGLSLYQEATNNFRSFTEADGLSNNTIVAILQHDNGDIWVSTSSGLSIIDREDYSITTLTPEDGIGGYEFTAGHLKEASGTLLFSGTHGITSIPSDFFTSDAFVPKMYISNIEVLENSLDVPLGFFNNHKLNFKPSENMLTFNFLALDYDAPDQIKYYYKLAPLNSKWISTGTSDSVTYSNLKAGEYTLWAYAQSSRGFTSEAVKVEFQILKPWYFTWMAFFLYLLIGVYMIHIFIKLRESKFLKVNNKRLEELSTKDALTGVYNRRYFESVAEQQLQLAKRSQVPMGILMIDIDDFKLINDTQGHLAGDEALKNIAQTIQKMLHRSTDFVARIGGDEFAIALYDTSLDNIIDFARNIQEQLISSPITISIGLHSQIPDDEETVSGLVSKADHYLYESKAKGKNRVSYDLTRMPNVGH